MKVRELFKSTGLTQSIGGTAISLDRENCQIVKKTKGEFHRSPSQKRVRRKGRTSAFEVKDEFETISAQLLNWAIINDKAIGFTLNQLADFETNLNIEKVQGRIQLISNE